MQLVQPKPAPTAGGISRQRGGQLSAVLGHYMPGIVLLMSLCGCSYYIYLVPLMVPMAVVGVSEPHTRVA